jgi:hypothetical protein
LLDHRVREIDADYIGATTRCRRREIAGSGRDIKELDAGMYLKRIEQRIIGLRCQFAKIRVIRLCDCFPALTLKGAEFVLSHVTLHPGSPYRAPTSD